MSTLEIKSLLHESINNIDDVKFLEAVKTIVYSKYKPSQEPILSKAQKKRIIQSMDQIKKGHFKSNDEVFKAIDEGLNK